MPRHLRIKLPCTSDFDLENYQEIFEYLIKKHKIVDFSYNIRIKNTGTHEIIYKIYCKSPSTLKIFKIEVENMEFVGCKIDLYGSIVSIKHIDLLKGEIYLSLL